jgi:hypothetical protein
MLLALATMSLLGAGADYSVVVARRLGLDPARAAELADLFAQGIEKAPTHPLGRLLAVEEATAKLKAAGFPDTSVCSGSAACVSSLARVSDLKRIIALQLVKIGGDLAVDASVVEGEAGRILGTVTRTVKLKSPTDELNALALELVAKLPKIEVAASDAPAQTDLTPPPTPPEQVELTPPARLPTGRKVALGLGAGALAGLGVGIALGASALGQSQSLSAIDPKFEEKAAAARGTALGADLSYVGAGALAIGAVIAWFASPPPD